MRIAIMGAGALGGYFGARLAASGADVWLIARGAHLAAMQAKGLHLHSPNGDLFLPHVQATDDPAQVGPVDAVLCFVKTYDLAEAAHQMQPLLGPDTVVATFQNGVSAPGIVAKVVGADRVLPGVARIPAEIASPGVIHHTGPGDRLIFGGQGARLERAAARLHGALNKAGTDPVLSKDIERELWDKFVLQSATSAVTSLTRLTFGQICAEPQTEALVRRAMDETATVARAVHPRFPADMVTAQVDAFHGLGGTATSSMANDLLRGRKLELEWISGEVVRLGRLHQVPTPVHQVALAALWPYRNGAPSPA